MPRYLTTNERLENLTLEEALRIAHAAMDRSKGRKPGNTDGDGKPYITHVGEIIPTRDGHALELRDEDVLLLTESERTRVTDTEPTRDAEPTDDGGRATKTKEPQ